MNYKIITFSTVSFSHLHNSMPANTAAFKKRKTTFKKNLSIIQVTEQGLLTPKGSQSLTNLSSCMGSTQATSGCAEGSPTQYHFRVKVKSLRTIKKENIIHF